MNCLEFRRLAGAEPAAESPEADAHAEGCPACARYRQELREMDRLLGRAMQVSLAPGPAAAIAPAAPPRRWFALAASLLAGVLVASLLWVAYPRPTLAAEVLTHAAHEPASWTTTRPLPAAAVAGVLDPSGARIRPEAGSVTFAKRCFFDLHWVPHLVVQTAAGPVTVFLLGHREVSGETRLQGEGYTAVVLPAPRGSIAIVGRDIPDLDGVARQVFESVEWPG